MQIYSYSVRHRNGWGTGTGPRPTHCATCKAELPAPPHTGGSGYGCTDETTVAPCLLPGAPAAPEWFAKAQAGLKKGETITRSLAHCYSCCSKAEEARMIETGRATLYLSRKPAPYAGVQPWRVSDWSGGLHFEPRGMRQSRNNFGAQRRDCWFIGPDGRDWHGVNIGDNQILRCKRLKAPA